VAATHGVHWGHRDPHNRPCCSTDFFLVQQTNVITGEHDPTQMRGRGLGTLFQYSSTVSVGPMWSTIVGYIWYVKYKSKLSNNNDNNCSLH
jgi:hypothetical protein